MLEITKTIISLALLIFYSSILTAGDIGVEGSVTATTFIGSGAELTGVVKSEIDPIVDTLVPDKWCKADAAGTVIQCVQDAPPTPVTFQLWVPKTGQTECWDEDGDPRVDCTNTGEDGEYQIGGRTIEPTNWSEWHPAFRADPRFTDNSDGTVTDNLTGLVWLKNANCIVDNPGFDNDLTVDDGQVRWQTALNFVRGMNTGLYDCGDTSNSGVSQTDWRLPNFNELTSLIDPTQINPALSSGHPFSGVQLSNYWSSTSASNFPQHAYRIYLGVSVSYTVSASKTADRNVWPVRGGQ